MKRFLLTLTAIFICTIAYAENITINWGVDNKPYTTTTCTVGDDVVLPSVSKRGHIFRGWTAEHFDRGTFADWTSVPTISNYYQKNVYENTIPYEGDFIIVENTEDYCSDIIYLHPNSDNLEVTYLDVSNTYNLRYYNSETKRLYIANNKLSVWLDHRWWQFFYAVDKVVYNGNVYDTGDFIFSTAPSGNYIIYTGCRYSGVWRFKYEGIWETDGKNGWKPDVQISNE